MNLLILKHIEEPPPQKLDRISGGNKQPTFNGSNPPQPSWINLIPHSIDGSTMESSTSATTWSIAIYPPKPTNDPSSGSPIWSRKRKYSPSGKFMKMFAEWPSYSKNKESEKEIESLYTCPWSLKPSLPLGLVIGSEPSIPLCLAVFLPNNSEEELSIRIPKLLSPPAVASNPIKSSTMFKSSHNHSPSPSWTRLSSSTRGLTIKSNAANNGFHSTLMTWNLKMWNAKKCYRMIRSTSSTPQALPAHPKES